MSEISENNPHEIFIKTLKISNYKGFKACEKEDLSDAFSVEFCTPNGIMGSGLTILLGDNNCGKTTILDAVNLATIDTPTVNRGLRAKKTIYNNENKDIAVRFRLTSNAVLERRMTAYGVHEKNSDEQCYEGNLSQRPQAPSFYDDAMQHKEKFGYFNGRIHMTRKEHREKMMVKDFIDNHPNDNFSRFMDTRDFDKSRSVGGYPTYNRIEKNIHLLRNTQTDPVYTHIFHMPEPDPLYASYPDSYSYNYSRENSLKTKLEQEYDTLGDGTLVFSSIKERTRIYEKQRPDKTSYYKKNIFLIDEPEEALHPRAITELVKFLCDIGKTCQIILTTHSLQIVEDVLSLLRENNQKEPEKHFRILTKENGKISLTDMSECFLRYISASEVNYVAFGRATAGYYVELFEEIKGKYIPETNKKIDAFFEKVTEAADIDGKGMNYRSNRNHIVHDERHQIAENTKMTFADFLVKGISDLRGVLKYIKTHPEQYPEIKKEDKD